MVQAWDVLKGTSPTGHNVVVVGGGSVGLETAVFLAIQRNRLAIYSSTSSHYTRRKMPEVLRDLMVKGIKEVTVIETACTRGTGCWPVYTMGPHERVAGARSADNHASNGAGNSSRQGCVH